MPEKLQFLENLSKYKIYRFIVIEPKMHSDAYLASIFSR